MRHLIITAAVLCLSPEVYSFLNIKTSAWLSIKQPLYANSYKPLSLDWNILSNNANKNYNQSNIEIDEPIILSVDDIKKKWKSKNKKADNSLFSLETALPYLTQENSHIALVNETLDKLNQLSEDEIYITEQELQRIWKEASVRPFGKPMESFDIKESLLLLPDEDYDIVMGGDTAMDFIHIDEAEIEEEIIEPELFITIDVSHCHIATII